MKESLLKAQVTLRDYLFIIFHRKKYFLVPALIVFFTAAIGSFFLPRYYSSSVLVVVQEDEKAINPLSIRPQFIPGQSPTLVEQLKTLTEKILNYPQLRMLVSKLELDKNITNPIELEKQIYTIRKSTQVRLRSPEVFEITFEHRDPVMAQKIVNEMVRSFIEYNVDKKRKFASIGIKFAESQAEVYKEKLEDSERKLMEFRKDYPFQSQGTETDLNVSLLSNYQTSLTASEITLKEIRSRILEINQQLDGQKSINLTDETLQSNPIIDSLNTKLKNAQIALDDLIQDDPSSTRIVDLEMEIDDLRRRLIEETEKQVNSQTPQTAPLLFRQLEQNRDDLISDEADMGKRVIYFKKLVQEYESRIESLPEQQQILANLLRDQRVNSNIYEMLRLKVEENRLDAVELEQRGIQYDILEEGRISFKPSKPQKLIISIVAFILGIICGLACVFMVELGDHSFRNIEDARRFLDVPVIGSTMKILTQAEYQLEKKKQTRFVVIFFLVFLAFIVIAGISSFVQEQVIMDKIINQQFQDR